MDIYPVGLLRKEVLDKAVHYHHIYVIRGIQVDGCEIKVTQLADNTTCFDKDKASLRHFLSIFKQF